MFEETGWLRIEEFLDSSDVEHCLAPLILSLLSYPKSKIQVAVWLTTMANSLRYHHLPSSSLSATASFQLSPPQFPTKRLVSFGNWVNNFRSKSLNFALYSALAIGLSLTFTGLSLMLRILFIAVEVLSFAFSTLFPGCLHFKAGNQI